MDVVIKKEREGILKRWENEDDVKRRKCLSKRK